jgi:rubrerythrin
VTILHRRGRTVDERALEELIAESQDLHSDAIVVARQTIPDLRDLAADRRLLGEPTDPVRIGELESSRSSLLGRLGVVLGGVIGFGAVSGAFARPAGAAAADGEIDVMILQTAVSLELLAVATYEAALGLPFIKDGNAVVKAFAETTMKQHAEHRAAFSAQTKALGGTDQTATNPKYTPIVEQAKPTLKGPAEVVQLAATLEEVATDTYLADLKMFTDVKSRVLMASVMGVECQHLATLRAVGALLGTPELIAIPTDLAKLPAAAGSIAFPTAFETPNLASPPEEGAVK